MQGAVVTPAQLAERRALVATGVTDAKAGLSGVLLQFMPGTPQHSAIREANATISELAHRLNVVTDCVAVYADPGFYLELPPSRAKDDQGEHARLKLEEAFSQ